MQSRSRVKRKCNFDSKFASRKVHCVAFPYDVSATFMCVEHDTETSLFSKNPFLVGSTYFCHFLVIQHVSFPQRLDKGIGNDIEIRECLIFCS